MKKRRTLTDDSNNGDEVEFTCELINNKVICMFLNLNKSDIINKRRYSYIYNTFLEEKCAKKLK